MKCANCDGTGKEKLYDKLTHAYLLIKCAYCNGTGEVEQTEQEYIQTCNAEQLAEVLNKIFMTRTFCHICQEGGVCDIGYECKYHGGNTKDFVEWLKQPHHESVSNCNE